MEEELHEDRGMSHVAVQTYERKGACHQRRTDHGHYGAFTEILQPMEILIYILYSCIHTNLHMLIR